MTPNRDASRRLPQQGRGASSRKPQPRPQAANGYPSVPPPPPQRYQGSPRPIQPTGYSPTPTPSPIQPPAPPPRPAFVPSAAAYEPGFADDMPDLNPVEDAPRPAPRPIRLPLGKLASNWTLWSLLSLTAVGGVGVLSALSLFRIPNLPNCRAIFWPTASATTRIQCAQAYSEQGTVDGYLEAIKLVEQLPADHPLRGEINQRVEEWASKVLSLAEEAFHAGKLDDAIGIAHRIPNQTAAAGLVKDRVGKWKQIWEKAEGIYEAAKTDLSNRNFPDAFTKAIQLLNVGNRYWETTKYEELTQMISQARVELNKLGKARELARSKTLDGFLEAIKIATSIESKSPLYSEAQDLLKEFGRDMLDLAEDALGRKDVDTANKVLKAIPAQAKLSEEVADFRTLIDAYQLSWQGTKGMEGAILRLQSIGKNRPLYARAQALQSKWQAEIEGRSRLEWAQRVAEPGTTADLQAAIAEAEQVPRSNPVWDEAQDQIRTWRKQIETTEDRPYLDQAEQLALNGDLAGAIDAASAVRPGRALYGEAQDLIDKWTGQLQEAEDAPILAQARELAAAGRLQDAIATASQIGSGRSLHSQAQKEIDRWRGQLQGQQSLQDAYQFAQQGTPDALVTAIGLAQKVPESSAQYGQAQQTINGWSWDILHLAETESQYNPSRAVEIARKVPTKTDAYAQAQLRIQEWQKRL